MKKIFLTVLLIQTLIFLPTTAAPGLQEEVAEAVRVLTCEQLGDRWGQTISLFPPKLLTKIVMHFCQSYGIPFQDFVQLADANNISHGLNRGKFSINEQYNEQLVQLLLDLREKLIEQTKSLEKGLDARTDGGAIQHSTYQELLVHYDEVFKTLLIAIHARLVHELIGISGRFKYRDVLDNSVFSQQRLEVMFLLADLFECATEDLGLISSENRPLHIRGNVHQWVLNIGTIKLSKAASSLFEDSINQLLPDIPYSEAEVHTSGSKRRRLSEEGEVLE